MLLRLSILLCAIICSPLNAHIEDAEIHYSSFFKNQQVGQIGNPAPLANLEGEPSALVHQCVNVISGQFCLYQTDLIAHHAIDPLSVDRSFAGSKLKGSPIGTGWHINHSSCLFFET